MKLPQDFEEQPKMSPSVIYTAAGVSVFVLVVLTVVLLVNMQERGQRNPKPSPERPVQQEEDVSGSAAVQKPVDYPDTENLVGGELKPEDLDFWDMYPVKEEEEPEPEEGEKEEITQSDPATDGKHTLIKYSNGESEWALISPYLPKHEYDFTKLVCQSDRMKYYKDGKQISFVGVEISKYQEYVDFNKLKKDGIDFVMIRVGARGYGSGQLVMDEYFLDNMKRASDAGLEIGVYFFSQAVTEDEVVEEANLVLQSIQDYTVTYPVVFDMEYIENDTARVEQLSRDEKTVITKKFLKLVKDAGYNAMLYGNKEWLMKRIELSQLTDYDVWLSQPGDVPDYPYRFSMWEYTNTGTADGVAGHANLSISFIDYGEK